MRGFKNILFFLLFVLAAGNAQASIVMKVISVNPSKQQSQRVPVKAYLPKEIKPENIVDKGDLEIGYDNQQGSYYAYGEYELKPGEMLERTIEMSDIWAIPVSEIEMLRIEADNIVKSMVESEFKERLHFLYESIDSKLKEIQEKQNASDANPEKHISDYRDNLKLLESVKADLVVSRSLLTQSKPFSSATIWKLFFLIVGSLGILVFIFNVIWQVHLKKIYAAGFVPGSAMKEEPPITPPPTVEKDKENITEDRY